MGQVLNVSVLFTDLVGSTALSSSVSPDAADGLRRAHFGVLRRAIAEVDGTEVKNLGDGLMVVFSTASAALGCAVGMQKATELDNRSREVPFGLRVGVSAGEVVEEDDDFFGDAVVEAARLCARCEAGQVLATDVVRLMAGRRNPHRCVTVGELELKGLPEPVSAIEVAWEPVAAAETAQRVPLPARLTSRPVAGVVGRSVEAEALLAAVKRTGAGDGREVVVVAGEAGLGKTTLVAEVARAAFVAGACVLFGHAEEDLSTPYGLFVEAFGHLVTHVAEDDLRAYVGDAGSDLARIVPALTRRLPELDVSTGSDAESERHLLFGSVVDLVRHVAAQRPVVLVLDDLQWADSGSLQLLRHLAGADPGLGLLVLGTYRDSEVAAGHPLVETLGALWRMERVSRVDLQGLDDRGVVELLEATAGHALDDPGVALAHALYRETDGNPFFVSEVLRHLVETGALYQDEAGRWVSDLSVDEVRLPDSVREVVGARIGRLGPHAARVLSTAAVIGRDFDLELLAHATDIDEDDLLDLLEAAEAAALVRAPTSIAGRFVFAHALIQRTLYQDISASRRARTHERVAEALEELTAGRPGARVGELAHHWANALRPADNHKAVTYAARAGDAALAALAPADAVRWYAQALELAGPDGDAHQRAEILVGLGIAQRQDGIAAHRETLLEAARLADETDDVALLVRAALANNRGWNSALGIADEERIAAIDRALERLGASPDVAAERARLLAIAALERVYVSTLAERVALAEQAVAVARSAGDPVALPWVQQRVSTIGITHPSTLSLRTAWTEEACAFADRSGDPVLGYWAHNGAFLAALERADGDSLEAHVVRAEECAARVPDAAIQWNLMLHRAWIVSLSGDLEAFEQLAEAALAYGLEHDQADAFGIYAVQLSALRTCQGRFQEMVPLVEQALVDTPALTAYRPALEVAKAYAGEIDSARSMLAADAAAGFPMLDDTGWSTGVMCWVLTAWLTGGSAYVPELRAMLVPFHDQIVMTGATVYPAVAHFLGLLDHLAGDHDTAEEWFTEALALHGRVRSPLFTALTHAAYAALLADRNRGDDHARARTMAQAALDAATTGGYGYVAADARAGLDRLG